MTSNRMQDRLSVFLIVAAMGLVGCATRGAEMPLASDVSLTSYRAFEIETATDDTGRRLPAIVAIQLTKRLKAKLVDRGLAVARRQGSAPEVGILRTSLISYQTTRPTIPEIEPGSNDEVIVKISVVDRETSRVLIDFVAVAKGKSLATSKLTPHAGPLIDDVTTRLADEIARSIGGLPATSFSEAEEPEQFRVSGRRYRHIHGGAFLSTGSEEALGRVISLKQIEHAHDLGVDTDVPPFTNVTLNDRVPPLVDEAGRSYALITLYNIDPPLEDLPSAETGIDRGMDFRDPANLVKGAYSNYVSPVYTLDPKRRPVSGHPIGHFFVKVEIPDYPTILTGMTTIERADEELADLTLGRQLGLGGVLLTLQPGRLNSASQALDEISRRQSKLIVIDGRYYRNVRGTNVGPTYVIEDGNVTFARFKLPIANAKDGLRMFLEYVERGGHNKFGAIINRPYKGTGAGCAGFAFAWLKAVGFIPFVDETEFDRYLGESAERPDKSGPLWTKFYRRMNVPWEHIGCDDRLGLKGYQAADFTVYDLLFHGETRKDLVEASQGLVNRLREDIGILGATLFQFGAFTPLRDIFIHTLRKDPGDEGDYAWGESETSLRVGFWENSLFSDWIKDLWQDDSETEKTELVREGRFYGVEIDAMDTPRQTNSFFKRADEIAERRKWLEANGIVPTTCRELFTLGIH